MANGLLSPDLMDAYRRQQFNQGLLNMSRMLLSLGGQQGAAAALPGPSMNMMDLFQMQQAMQAQKQQQDQATRDAQAIGGMDPKTGIEWQTGRQAQGPVTAVMPPDAPKGMLGIVPTQEQVNPIGGLLKPPQMQALQMLDPQTRNRSLAEIVTRQPPQEKLPTGLRRTATGEIETIPEYVRMQKELRQAGKPEMTFQIGPQQTKEQETRGKMLAESFGAVSERARASQDAINQLSIAKAVATTSELPSQLKATAGNFAVALGIPLSGALLEQITSGQAFTGVMQNLVLTKMQAQKGPQTENDARRIEATLANLGNTPEARAFLIEVGINLARRDVLERDFWETWYANRGTYDGAARAWNQHIGGVPLIGVSKEAPELPIFYPEFEEIMREDRPDISDEEILRLWKQYYG